ncbi:MAG: hypothetical protein HWE18_06335 [Gammaproteobacteria bacterium]|nr:hypothetical protein [Gammaproteobacteria bacterium]
MMMTYSVHPKVYRLQHEIHTLERHMRNAQQRMGMNNPAILHNYREMIRTRKELMDLLNSKGNAGIEQDEEALDDLLHN